MTVHFVPWDTSRNLMEESNRLYDEAGTFEGVKKGDLVAIKFVNKENLSKALASAAFGVLSTFKRGKVSFVSFAKDITEYCGCLSGPGEIAMNDVGIFASDSPVSVDAAFLMMVDYRVFNVAYNVDCMLQVQETKAIGIEGELNPEIHEIS